MQLTKSNKQLCDNNASLYVLSSLMRDPLLIEDNRYALIKTDFTNPLQQIVFYAVFNLCKQGVSAITPQDVDFYLKQYPTQYGYYEQNKGFEYVLNTYQLTEGSDCKQFDFYYNRLKKFSMLRDLDSLGYDISEFYDVNKDFLERDKQDERLNNIKLIEIPNRIREKLVEVENRHIGKDQGTAQDAAKGLRDLVEELKQSPEVGLPLDGDILNYATRGARGGKLYIYSAPSGVGKTRYMVGNACAISLPYIDDNKRVVVRDNLQKVLFVATEMKADEIQTLILAYVSGVNEKNILLGNYSPDEWERIQMAIDIIESYQENFIIESIPDPSMAMIKAKLAKYIVQDSIEYIYYDYIFSSPGLLSEFRDIEVREDVALMMLSNTLKEVAMTYGVFIQSATQLNDNWSKQDTGLRDQNCIRGSKAIVDKVDIGMIAVRLADKEKNMVDDIVTELKRTGNRKYLHDPNIVIDLYKNRRGEMAYIKVFRWFDHATCRCQDLFVTDTSYKIMQVGELIYEKHDYAFEDLVSRGVIKCRS